MPTSIVPVRVRREVHTPAARYKTKKVRLLEAKKAKQFSSKLRERGVV